MIIFSVVTSFTDDIFDTLYAGCSEDLSAGSYPWHLYTSVTTDEQKKEHLKDSFNRAPFMFTVYEDDHPLMLNAGTISDGVFKWYLGLIGPDASGSKAWLYRNDYSQARNSFWPTQGITAWHVETLGSGTAMHDHIVKARNVGTIPGEFTSKDTDHLVTKETELRFTV